MTTTRSPTCRADGPAAGPVVVPFPYANRLPEKRRPAVVVSAPAVARAGLLWIAMITTARRGLDVHDVPVDDLDMAGLRVPCVVRSTKIACIDPARALRNAGRLTPETAGDVLERVRAFVADDLPSRYPE